MPQIKDTDWRSDKESRPIALLYSGDPSHLQRHIQAQTKGMEEDLPSKWKAKNKKAGVAIPVSDKTNFKPTKIKRQRRSLHNGKGINATRSTNTLNIYMHQIQEHPDS